jgi:DNA-binding transcriptional LysR family regulator
MMMDLNLLRVFDAVMTERHVGRAAEKVARSQPAVSNAISRLRSKLDDPLFIRAPNGVTPTPKAEELWREIGPAIDALRASTEKQRFDPGKVVGQLHIACTDFESTLLLSQILRTLKKSAPAINVIFIPGSATASQAALQNSNADIALGFLPASNSAIRSRILFEDSFCVAMHKKNPLARKQIELRNYVKADHLLVSPPGDRRGVVDEILAARGLSRRIALVINHFHLIPDALAASDLLATASEKLMSHFGPASGLVLRPPPLTLPPIQIGMYWHRRSDADQRLSWLRKLLLEALANKVE